MSGKIEADEAGGFCIKKSKIMGEQVAYALRQAALDVTLAEVYRKMGVSEATFYR